MITTPWGRIKSEPSREAKLDGHPPAEFAERPPRERLYAAMVASCAKRGYDATTVADLLEISGVSRATFYEYFDNKEECYVETEQALLDTGLAAISAQLDPEKPTPEQARDAFLTFMRLVREQPAAARLVLVEAYAVGEPALTPMRDAIERLARYAARELGTKSGQGTYPEELSMALIGGVNKVLFSRLQAGEDLEGIEEPLWDWFTSIPPPPQRLRLRGRVPRRPTEGVSPFALYNPAERIIAAFEEVVAEKGYYATTISDIAARASISQRTFYEYFEGKWEILMAALDSSGMQLTAAIVPALNRTPGWPQAVRAMIDATCRFFAAEPALAHLRVVEVYAAGPEALAKRDAGGARILKRAFDAAGTPEIDPVAREATLGALYTIVHERVRTREPAPVIEAIPLLTYTALVPFVGPERACEVANDDGRRRVTAA